MHMSTLYLDHKNSRIKCRRHTLQVSQEGQSRPRSYPLSLLNHLVIVQNAEMDAATLATLASHGISVALLSGRRELHAAFLTGRPGNDARRRLMQYTARQDPDLRRRIVAHLLRAKLAGQYRLISRLLRHRPDQRRILTRAGKTLRENQRQITSRTAPVDVLRGLEGSASAATFSALSAVLPPVFGFKHRQRRPPPDPVNALLSLSYTLAHGLALRECLAAGLDPAIGYLHDPQHDRASLALDLIEPQRPIIEYRIWHLLRKRRLDTHHFTQSGDACLLNKEGRQRFYPWWEGHTPAMTRLMRRHLHGQLARVQGEIQGHAD